MFERCTDRARRVVVLASEEARRLDHNYVGTEHLLLALIHEGESVAAQALTEFVSLGDVRSQVEKIIGRGSSTPPGHIPFTPRVKKVFEFSLREALQLGHNYIGPEHFLLGLIREGEGVGAQVLLKMQVDSGAVRQWVVAKITRADRLRRADLAGTSRNIERSVIVTLHDQVQRIYSDLVMVAETLKLLLEDDE